MTQNFPFCIFNSIQCEFLSIEGLKQVKAVKPDLIILDVMMDTITEGFQVSY